MCGIIGIASRHPVEDRAWVAAGRDAMRHRGPDDAGEWWCADGRVGFGHRRLAIVDLSPGGHQPMLDATGRLCIVFNGEIYNFLDLRKELEGRGHAFRSQSDTEVVLAAYREWGVDCLARLNGMFALALYDSSAERLFLARDRAGEKPLFYALTGQEIRFASELKGLLAAEEQPRVLDWGALDCYLAEGFVPGRQCILQGVNKLPAAHALLFRLDTGQAKLWRYWDLPDLGVVPDGRGADAAELLDELQGLLQDAVRRQLVADVPVGVLLSGGTDSSLVTAMAARTAGQLKTFTVRFPSHSRYDETEHARLVARHFGTEHIELDAENATVDMLPRLARQFDEPIIDSSMIPTALISGLVKRHCTVALGGDGGDELFAGYRHYVGLLRLQQRSGLVPLGLRRVAARSAELLLPLGFRGRNWLQALGVDFDRGVPLIASYFDAGARRQLLPQRGAAVGAAEAGYKSRVPRGADLLQRAGRMDFQNYLAEDILVKTDRSSMMHSIELRTPMLDHRIVEFAFRKVPSSLKATPAVGKILLKKLAARVLPPEFDRQRKQGFSIPIASWLQRGPWHERFREVLLDSAQRIFDHGCVERLLQGQSRGRTNGERLFGLVMFELWRREYRVQI